MEGNYVQKQTNMRKGIDSHRPPSSILEILYNKNEINQDDCGKGISRAFVLHLQSQHQ